MTLVRVHKLSSKVGALLTAPCLAIALAALFGCGFPYHVQRAVPATPCPPSATPERSMTAEAQIVREYLTAHGIAAAEVFAIGLQNCPNLPAETVSWFYIDIPVDDLSDTAYLGEMLPIIRDSTAQWPDIILFITFQQRDDPAQTVRLYTTSQAIQDLRVSGLTGAALFEKLLKE